MDTYEKRRRWSDQYLREIKDLVGPHLLQATPKWIDIDEASDLMVLGARSQTVAARVRKHRYLERYPHDITFRAKTWGGHKSEMEKVMDGFGDLFFYGFASQCERYIEAWRLVDLHAFRRALMGVNWEEQYCTNVYRNGDGTALRSFDVRSLPRGIVVARSGDPGAGYIC